MSKPRIPITSKDFVYRPAHKTDVRLTWEAARKAMNNVTPIKAKSK